MMIEAPTNLCFVQQEVHIMTYHASQVKFNKKVYDNKRLSEKVRLTKAQIEQIGTSTLDRYMKRPEDKLGQYLDL